MPVVSPYLVSIVCYSSTCTFWCHRRKDAHAKTSPETAGLLTVKLHMKK